MPHPPSWQGLVLREGGGLLGSRKGHTHTALSQARLDKEQRVRKQSRRPPLPNAPCQGKMRGC